MDRFVLQPCKLRSDRIVPKKGEEPISLTWKELALKFAANRRDALAVLRRIRIGAFVGKVRKQGSNELSVFMFLNDERSGRMGVILKRDPTFEERLVEVYRVEGVSWNAKTHELEGTTNRPPR